MKQNCMTLIELVVCVATFSIPVSAEEGATKNEWQRINSDVLYLQEPRYAQINNQTATWTAAGHIPAYRVSYTNDEVFIDSDGNPDYRGIVMLGHRFTVPQTLEEMPAALRINIEYQTWNQIANRSCTIEFYLMTADRYEQFSADPAAAQLNNLPWFTQSISSEEDWGVLAQEEVYHGLEDLEQWTPWRSPDLAPYLRNHAGQELVAVFAFIAAHQNALQWGRYRSFSMDWMDASVLPPRPTRKRADSESTAIVAERFWIWRATTLPSKPIFSIRASIHALAARAPALSAGSAAQAMILTVSTGIERPASLRKWLKSSLWSTCSAGMPRASAALAKASATLFPSVMTWLSLMGSPGCDRAPVDGSHAPLDVLPVSSSFFR